MLKTFQKNIIAQIILLLCLFVFSLAAIYIGQKLMQKRQAYLQMLLENEQVKMELSHILQKKILALNVKLSDMSTGTSVAELRRTMTHLSVLESELMEILIVIDRGGTQQIKNLISFGFEKTVPRKLKYKKFGKQKINIEVLELKTRVLELKEIVREFLKIVEQKIYILESKDLIQIADSIRRVDNYYKGIEPFLKRMLENSHSLHSQSLEEMKRLRKISSQFNQTYKRVTYSSTFVTLIFIMSMGGLVLKSSRKILLERQHYQQQLLKINENLEDIVQTRTFALEKEITDRKQAELEIIKQENFLRKVIESLDYPFYVIDVKTLKIVLANSAALKDQKLTDANCHVLSCQRNTPCSGRSCPIQQVINTKAPTCLERQHRNAQGQEAIVEVHSFPIFDNAGNLVQIIEYLIDITDKKKNEIALKQAYGQLEEKVKERTRELEEQILQRELAQSKLTKSERHYRRIIETISDLITIVDSQGIISYTSPSSLKTLGITLEDVIGHNIRDLVDPADIKGTSIPALFEKFDSNHPLEYRILTKSGRILLMEAYIYKFEQDDGSDGYILSSRDTTARKRSEEETHKLKMVVEQFPISIVITDTNGKIEYVNPAFEQISGYSIAEAIGQNPRKLQSSKIINTTFKELWKTITAGEVWRGEFINKKKNGELYDEDVLSIPIKNLKGEITNFVAVKENTTEIKKARKEAENANRAKSSFLSQMSHELRTPLNAINGFSQLMLKSKKNPLNEKQKTMVGQIHTAGQHLLQLINEVLDLARIESGEFSLSIEPLDPHIVLDDCLSLTSSIAKEKSITIISRYGDKKLPLVKADLTRVKQILLNLLSNAVKYNKPQGAVTVDVETDIPEVLRFVVTDNGIGIPAEKQKELFTPFTRMIDNLDDIEGTGIGMTITKQLVERMGGDINFESHLGKGSLFWFTLPVVREPSISKFSGNSIEIQNKTVPSATTVQKKSVLYVEDNPANITFMREFFSELENFKLITAKTGEAGITMALKSIPDLILMDINLPGIDGFQAYRQIKANPKTEFIPVVVVSADAMDKTVKRAHKMGFDGYVPKPVDVELLHKTITDILEG